MSTSPTSTPDMVDRFEYELDTTSPNEEWMKVVEANLAAKAAAGTAMTVRPDNRSPTRRWCRWTAGAVVRACWRARAAGSRPACSGMPRRRRAASSAATPKNLAGHSARGLFLACSALTESIVDAVRHGDLTVVDDSVPVAT